MIYTSTSVYEMKHWVNYHVNNGIWDETLSKLSC